MHRHTKLSTRLEEIIQLVPDCKRVVDIGTDHALVPIALLCRGRTQNAIGVDKSPLPLGQATVNRHNAGVVDQLQLICASGLGVDDLQDTDVVIMAGMGGRTMREVLQTSSWKGCLIVQPNRDLPELRRWLSAHGWYSEVETIVRERKQYFWTSRWRRGVKEIEPLDIEFGYATHQQSNTIFTAWFHQEYNRLRKLPECAIDKQKLSLYQKMAQRLSP